MTTAEMARLHQAAFVMPRAWSEAEILDLLISPYCFATGTDHGFVVGRVVAGEAELLTIAVEPLAQRQGFGHNLMGKFMAEIRARHADTAFLEVAETNLAARALYAKWGFAEVGRRRGYYVTQDGHAIDALVLTRAVQAPDPSLR